MPLRIALPPSDVERYRWPDPDLAGRADLAAMAWGLRAWEWMAQWCPTALATISDPAAHFAALDEQIRAEEVRLLESTPAAFQDRVDDQVASKWVKLPPEVDEPVWDPEWSDVIRYREPIRQLTEDGEWLELGRERAEAALPQLAIAMLRMWTQDDDERTYLLPPSEMQGLLDRMSRKDPLALHLLWDRAARRARTVFPTDPEYKKLRDYPSPPY